MPKTLPNIVCILMMLAGIGTASAQEVPTIKASVDKNQILIGEPVRLNIDVKSPVTFGNQLPQFDSIPHFELIEKGSNDSLISGAGISYHLEWKLTSFDSGTRYIPAFSITIGKQVYKTDSLAIEVSYGKIDTAQDYHDIKGIIDVENPDVKYIPWVVGAVTLLALFLFIWFIRFPFVREPEVVEKTFHHVGPAEEALASLEKLKKMIHEDPSSVKKYYTGLHDTLRIFLNRRLNLITMEKTSEELILSLSEIRMAREDFSKLSAALRMGDFVKFAKYVPGPNENENNLEIIKSAIQYIDENSR